MPLHAVKLTAEDIESPADNRDAPASLTPKPSAKLALVVPTLREAVNIRAVLDRIRQSLDPLAFRYEILVVDDDSGDGIDLIVQEISQEDPRVRLLIRKGERGLGGAVLYGWKHTNAEVLGVIDADLQHPPELLPRLWEAMDSGRDVVLASRYAPQGGLDNWHPARHLLSKMAIWLTYPLQKREIQVNDPMAGFFMVRRSCLKDIELHNRGFKILLEILVRGNVQSVSEIPFTFGPRRAGTSKANIRVGLDYFGLLYRLWKSR
ncbi:MAG TPA: polyprenol monophosphomannose synthase [Terriglobales bacterium]|nr:polyprenol monophosphomannose synthase [Terriglobales bacterium]